MRRKDREITDPEKIEDIIKRCTCCRIGFNDDSEVYIVPLSFGYELKDAKYTFYFHGASEGRKIDLIQTRPEAGFEMDTNYALNEADIACGYSARFQSIIGNGTMSMVTGEDAKLYGLSLIMEHYTGKKEWEFDADMVKEAAVFKLEVSKMSCKEHH